MSIAWRAIILHADKKIETPKPSMRTRFNRIIADHFAVAKKFSPEGEIVDCPLKLGEYPNYQQVKDVLNNSD